MLAKYTQWLIKRPYPTKMITSGLIFGASDVIVQKYIEKKPKLSLYRMGCSMAVGGLYLAPWIHIWFEKGIPTIAKKLIPKKSLKKPVVSVVSYMLIDQTLNSPQCNFLIISMFGFLDSFDLRKSVGSASNGIIAVLKTNYMVWPIAQLINFAVVPQHYQLLFVNFVGFFWTIYLNYASFQQIEKDKELLAIQSMEQAAVATTAGIVAIVEDEKCEEKTDKE